MTEAPRWTKEQATDATRKPDEVIVCRKHGSVMWTQFEEQCSICSKAKPLSPQMREQTTIGLLNEIATHQRINHEFIAGVIGSLENRLIEALEVVAKREKWQEDISFALVNLAEAHDRHVEKEVERHQATYSRLDKFSVEVIKRLTAIESKQDEQGERLDRESTEIRATLSVICEHQLKIEERFKAGLAQVERKLDSLGALIALGRVKSELPAARRRKGTGKQR